MLIELRINCVVRLWENDSSSRSIKLFIELNKAVGLLSQSQQRCKSKTLILFPQIFQISSKEFMTIRPKSICSSVSWRSIIDLIRNILVRRYSMSFSWENRIESCIWNFRTFCKSTCLNCLLQWNLIFKAEEVVVVDNLSEEAMIADDSIHNSWMGSA